MSFPIYKLIHVLGIALLLVALGGVSVHAASGQDRSRNPVRRLTLLLHGVGAFLALLGGFGMLAKLGAEAGSFFPAWAWPKLIIWLVLAAAVALPYRRQTFASSVLFLTPLLTLAAAYFALFKPF